MEESFTNKYTLHIYRIDGHCIVPCTCTVPSNCCKYYFPNRCRGIDTIHILWLVHRSNPICSVRNANLRYFPWNHQRNSEWFSNIFHKNLLTGMWCSVRLLNRMDLRCMHISHNVNQSSVVRHSIHCRNCNNGTQYQNCFCFSLISRTYYSQWSPEWPSGHCVHT